MTRAGEPRSADLESTSAFDGSPAAMYVDHVTKDLHDRIDRLDRLVETESAELQTLSRQVRQTDKALHDNLRKRRVLQEIERKARDAFKHDYDEIIRLPHVVSLRVTSEAVHVTTDTISVPHDGRLFEIGSFRIELSQDEGVRIINMANTGEKASWDHPHVQGGYPCLGNLRVGFDKLLAEYDILPLTAMLVQFLESYTPDTAYGSIELWREVGPS